MVVTEKKSIKPGVETEKKNLKFSFKVVSKTAEQILFQSIYTTLVTMMSLCHL